MPNERIPDKMTGPYRHVECNSCGEGFDIENEIHRCGTWERIRALEGAVARLIAGAKETRAQVDRLIVSQFAIAAPQSPVDAVSRAGGYQDGQDDEDGSEGA
jgi:hypothetical protein